MIRHELADLVRQAIERAQQKGTLPSFAPPPIPIDHSQKPEYGDYTCSVALKLAATVKRPPLQIAQTIAAELAQPDYLGEVTVTPPGFINLRLAGRWLASQVGERLYAETQVLLVDLGQGKRAQVEHISANPVGPLTVGSARNAAIGDTLARVLGAAGYRVETEYYLNDAGSQIRHFYESVYARYAQILGRSAEIPEDGYQGAYVTEIAQAIVAREGDHYLSVDPEEAIRAIGESALEAMLGDIRATVQLMNVHFDSWFSEASLHKSGLFSRMLELLRSKRLVYENEGATWFAATEFGLDQDAVLIRSAKVIPNAVERPTYLASDIPYLWSKLVERNFDRAIYVWGADHQGDVPRVKAAAKALGLDLKRVDILVYQHVLLKRGGEMVRMSKRAGEFITLREVIEEVGPDAVRFMLISRSMDSTMDFDLDLAKKQSDENPVYYVQYAHARIASILRHAAELGMADSQVVDKSLLTHPAERALILQMLQLAEVVELVATRLEPHHLPHYAIELASAFHAFYKQCRVLSSDPADREISRARLELARAAKEVLARTLGLMGVSAPESM